MDASITAGRETPGDGRAQDVGDDESVERSERSKRNRWFLLVAVAVLLGLGGRTLISGGVGNSFLADLLPWMQGTPATLFFGDEPGDYLVPVSRTLTGDAESPEGLVDALLAGPESGVGLVNLLAGTTVNSVTMRQGVLAVDLAGGNEGGVDPRAAQALRHTLESWPDADRVTITIDGRPAQVAPDGSHLLFFYDRVNDMLVASPTSEATPEDLLARYLQGPADPRLTGLPEDVEVLEFLPSPRGGLLQINMTYTPSVRDLATADGDAMRRILEGLIATLTTGFANTDYLYLDFEGHATLGLGQCANLLRRAQPPPEVLNDERLLPRASGA